MVYGACGKSTNEIAVFQIKEVLIIVNIASNDRLNRNYSFFYIIQSQPQRF